MKDLIVKKLEMGDTFTDKNESRVKVFTKPKRTKAKIRKKDRSWDRFEAITCLMAKIDHPLIKDSEDNPIPGIKTFEFYNGFYKITEDGKINLGKSKDFLPVTVNENDRLPN